MILHTRRHIRLRVQYLSELLDFLRGLLRHSCGLLELALECGELLLELRESAPDLLHLLLHLLHEIGELVDGGHELAELLLRILRRLPALRGIRRRPALGLALAGIGRRALLWGALRRCPLRGLALGVCHRLKGDLLHVAGCRERGLEWAGICHSVVVVKIFQEGKEVKFSGANKSAFCREHGMPANSINLLEVGRIKTRQGFTLRP